MGSYWEVNVDYSCQYAGYDAKIAQDAYLDYVEITRMKGRGCVSLLQDGHKVKTAGAYNS